MIEITFNTNARGTIIAAQKFGRGSWLFKGKPSMMFYGTSGGQPDEAQQEEYLSELEAQKRAEWEAAEPIDGDAEDVFGFHLMLSMGHIAGDVTGPERQDEVHQMLGFYDADGRLTEYNFMDAALSLHQVSHRIGWGEEVRIWYSDNADDYCGLLWFTDQLCEMGLPIDNIYLVKMPEWAGRFDGKTIFSLGTMEADEKAFQQAAKLQQKTSPEQIRLLAQKWQSMKEENTIHRQVVCGQPISVPDDFYDGLIWQVINSFEGEFSNDDILVALIKYGLRMDCWLQHRVDVFAAEGKLTVTGHDPERPWVSFFTKSQEA
ncbi:MAG: DUF1835 domain-containing protein [Firmicutes bacterium]|nr:DUF1835 domain-containing protein [Bacillota bacterium]